MPTSGVLDKTKLFSNLLMLILLGGNIYLGVSFINEMKKQTVVPDQTDVTLRVKVVNFHKIFIDKVLSSQGVISAEDRVLLENDIIQIHDPVLTTAWHDFTASKNSKDTQATAVKLMSLLVARE